VISFSASVLGDYLIHQEYSQTYFRGVPLIPISSGVSFTSWASRKAFIEGAEDGNNF